MEDPQRVHDRHARRRPFASWMKRLANLKSSHNYSSHSRPLQSSSNGNKKGGSTNNNNPYLAHSKNNHVYSDYTTSAIPLSMNTSRDGSFAQSKLSSDGAEATKSRAPTMVTTADTIRSDAGKSGAGTSTTVPRTEGDRDSTFSSPAPSIRSLTTTLTTLQSTNAGLSSHQALQSYQTAHPASAVPPHLVPHSHHTITHHMATANNVLSDDASILTLASSSKRRRRNSLDTNASIRALAPASMFGNSRESLPLSMLSAQPERSGAVDNASIRDTASSHYPYPRSTSAMNVERSSLISASGVTAPALVSERNSYIGSRAGGDGASIRSGFHGSHHGRNDSLGGISIARDRLVEKDRGYSQDYFKEAPMVTAPTSPMPG